MKRNDKTEKRRTQRGGMKTRRFIIIIYTIFVRHKNVTIAHRNDNDAGGG